MTATGDPKTRQPAGGAAGRVLRVLMWHVHGSWSTAFLGGGHHYLLPTIHDRGPDGRGRAATWDWPDNAIEVEPHRLHHEPVDVLIAQRPHELELAERWLGRRPGRDVPTVYVEHNTPRGDVPCTRHLLADRPDLTIVHVTHFNDVFWDCGTTPTTVIEHGVVDPGHRYTGDIPRTGVVINDPLRRWRVTGTDLLPLFAETTPLDLFGMGVNGTGNQLRLAPDRLITFEDLPQHEMHAALARRRAYLHPIRWTSLGLSLIEAMALGLPVVALASTEAVEAVPHDAGVVTTRLSVMREVLRELIEDPAQAREAGAAARAAALRRYPLTRFLSAWDRLLQEVTR